MSKFFVTYPFLKFLNLSDELDDHAEIHDKIEKDVVFKGTNLYILIFAIIIASVGLNVNSTAVIIGAMLISPLMGPINGLGYGLATFDFILFKRSLSNFIFAVVVSLITSTIYFYISPISTAQSELLSRTSPTIFDVLIALFGGLAGIVAKSSKLKGNVIPGVAIATALMPPMCTAGYGLAIGNYEFFFGALFLFTINTVFIALSSFLVSQLLKFPIRNMVDEKLKRKVTRWISAVSVLVVIPSLYFGYLLVERERFSSNSEKFVNSISVVEGNYLLKNIVNPKKKSIELVYGGANMSEDQKIGILEKLNEFKIPDAKVTFKQGLSFDVISKTNNLMDIQNAQINKLNAALENNKKTLDSLQNIKLTGKQLLSEIKTIFPQISGCSFSDSYFYKADTSAVTSQNILVLDVKSKLGNSDKEKILDWVQARIKSKSIKIYYE